MNYYSYVVRIRSKEVAQQLFCKIIELFFQKNVFHANNGRYIFLSTENVTLDDDNVSNITNDSCSVKCRDGFYINTTLCACLPRCDTWELYSHTTTVVTDVFTLLSACIGFIAGVAVLVISCIRRKRM